VEEGVTTRRLKPKTVGPRVRKHLIQVVEDATGAVVRELDVTSKSPGQRARVFDGLNRNLNHVSFTVREVTK
jgi:hypothetical protein